MMMMMMMMMLMMVMKMMIVVVMMVIQNLMGEEAKAQGKRRRAKNRQEFCFILKFLKSLFESLPK